MMSFVGSPRTAMRSARMPVFTMPMRSPQCIIFASFTVAARSASNRRESVGDQTFDFARVVAVRDRA